MVGVTGSIPVAPTKCFKDLDPILCEHLRKYGCNHGCDALNSSAGVGVMKTDLDFTQWRIVINDDMTASEQR